MKKILALILHFSFCILHSDAASRLSLASTNDYHWCTGAAPYRITGYGCGSVTTNLVNRGEDIAFLTEATAERNWCSDVLSEYQSAGASVIPFPSLGPYGWDFRRLTYAGFGLNAAMATNRTFVCQIYDASKFITGMKLVGNYGVDDQTILHSIFASGHPTYSRTARYVGPGTGPLGYMVMSGSQIFALYKDLYDNDALFFKCSTLHCDQVFNRWLYESESLHPNTYYPHIVLTNTASSSTSIYTNSSTTTRCIYRDTVYITKNRYATYENRELVDAKSGYSIDAQEGWNTGNDDTVIRFNSFFSNKIDRISAFAACHVDRSRWTRANGVLTETVTTNVVVLVPVTANRISSADDGTLQYSVDIDPPSIAFRIVSLLGLKFPNEVRDATLRALPDPPTPASKDIDIWHYDIEGIETRDTLEIDVIGIYGLVKLIYHAREIKE